MSDKKESFSMLPGDVTRIRASSESEILAAINPIIDSVTGSAPDFSRVTEAIMQSVAAEDARITQELEDLGDEIAVENGHFLYPAREDDDAW